MDTAHRVNTQKYSSDFSHSRLQLYLDLCGASGVLQASSNCSVMDQDEAVKNIIVERLIKTVSRCFYNDTAVVVLDALVREKFIREEELGPRLRLKEKDWRKVINQLEEELLIQSEKVLMEDMRQPSVYYIDYQMFVDIVRYRVYLMRKKVNSASSQEIAEVKYKCPTCKKIIGMTEAMLCKSKDYKFICTVCCPHDDFRQRPAEFDYTLQSENNTDRISSADNLKSKMDDALKASELHEGILDLLSELKDVPLTRNLPSDNMSMGVRNTTVDDDEVESAIRSNTRRAVIGKKGRFVASVEANAFGDDKKKFELSLDDDEDDEVVESAIVRPAEGEEEGEGEDEGPVGADSKRAKVLGILPDFLDRSGVYGSSSAYNIKSLNADTDGINAQQQDLDGGGAVDGEGGGAAGGDREAAAAVLTVGSISALSDIHQSVQADGKKTDDKKEGDEDDDEDDVDWDD